MYMCIYIIMLYIHVVWQKPTQHSKAIFFQLKKIKCWLKFEKKKDSSWFRKDLSRYKVGSPHSRDRRFLQCPLRLWQENFQRDELPHVSWTHFATSEITRTVVVVDLASQSWPFLACFHTCPYVWSQVNSNMSIFFRTVWSLNVEVWGMRGWSSRSWLLFPFLSKNLPGTEEQIKREASEREKDPSELKVKELQRQLKNQKRVLERLTARVRKEIREREKTSAGTGESSAHSGVGRFLQWSMRLLQE